MVGLKLLAGWYMGTSYNQPITELICIKTLEFSYMVGILCDANLKDFDSDLIFFKKDDNLKVF